MSTFAAKTDSSWRSAYLSLGWRMSLGIRDSPMATVIKNCLKKPLYPV